MQYEGRYYALKALSKAHVVQTQLQVGFQRGRAMRADERWPGCPPASPALLAPHLLANHAGQATSIFTSTPSCALRHRLDTALLPTGAHQA